MPETKEMKNRDVLVLGIETSCDETACSVVKNGREILSNVISSQIDLHSAYGGVVPEIASRMHVETVIPVIDSALREAGVALERIDAVGVTYGPGLVGALLVGVNAAKSIAFASGKPLIAVNHIEGHISANYLSGDDFAPPFICLVVSGGHSHILMVKNYGEYELLARTRDDAAGEAFDKVARTLGLGYPGGPAIEAEAENGNPDAIKFPRTTFDDGSLDFSFSGVKTAVINYANGVKQKSGVINRPDVAASFQKNVVEVLTDNTFKAVLLTGIHKIAIAGGVASNSVLRENFKARAQKMGVEFHYPPPVLCTDNAAMIACAAYYRFMAGEIAGLDLNACPSVELYKNKEG